LGKIFHGEISMTKRPGTPPLTLVDSAKTLITPPRALGQHGMNLWNGVLAEFDIRDRAGLELLSQAAACLDRAEGLAAQIDADGMVLRTRTGVRSHPAIRDETQCRAACVRILEKLGITREELRPMAGRPPAGWRG
jgi:hypothetical protein